ncbi:PREDICTED: venom serine protease 34-like [Acromyrmex echinatior]|uniref:venom serine protease 34-like n=1 Tax=Acromyrmex echinatior TaxID=103372 RepID=UPI000580FF92|nr:PREDICTED: venom serine protease 34-like [Acromyrmex echinatior]
MTLPAQTRDVSNRIDSKQALLGSSWFVCVLITAMTLTTMATSTAGHPEVFHRSAEIARTLPPIHPFSVWELRDYNFRCTLDRLTVYVNDSASQSYCGNEPFSIESTGRFMTIELSTSFWSSGVKFLCELQAINETDDNDSCRCGWKKPTKIVGGMDTGVNEYPMMAGLVDSLQVEVFCGATIISERHVLTAAHCLGNADPSTVGVLVGDYDLTTVSAKKSDQLVFPLSINLIPLQEVMWIYWVAQTSFDPFILIETGWGLTEFSGMKSNTLQKVTITVITNRQCRQQYPGISNNHICTYAEGKDACQFDSGGPVLWQNPATKREVLVGVITAGMGCGSKAGINMRVGAYIDWILSVTPSKCMKCTMRHICVIVSLRGHLSYDTYLYLLTGINYCMSE